MKFTVIKGYVKHGGSLHRKGAFFIAELEEVTHLISAGVLALVEDHDEPVTFSIGSSSEGGNIPIGGQEGGANVSDDHVITPEEFAKLSAPEQKKELEEIGIEPDSNAPGRLAQYTAWYDQTENE